MPRFSVFAGVFAGDAAVDNGVAMVKVLKVLGEKGWFSKLVNQI
jgi:hypothetical protein